MKTKKERDADDLANMKKKNWIIKKIRIPKICSQWFDEQGARVRREDDIKNGRVEK